MASILDFFQPGAMNAPVDQGISAALAPFADPRNKAALLQFGISAMQPSWGSPLAAVGRAVGSAGEAIGRQDEEERKAAETASKEELRGAQAVAAEARAGTAGARADLSAQRLGHQRDMLEVARERLKSQEQLGLLSRRVAVSKAYQQYVNDPFRDPKKPPLSFEEFKRAMGLDLGDTTSEGGDETAIPPAASPTAAQSQAQAPAGPTPQAQRKVGETYTPSSGPNAGRTYRWDGSKWQPI